MKSDREIDVLVRAVLEGVREPTGAMEAAWSEAEEYGDHPVEHHLNTRRWAAAIDALLGDG